MKYLNIYKSSVPNSLMKLQKQLSRKVGDKEYSKYVAVIPPEAVEKSGFKEGEDLEADAQKGKITLKRK